MKKATKNLEYAQSWLIRAIKDYSAFKKFVKFDRKTKWAVRCSDPALAVYLLQQSIEKVVKATAVASGQYTTNKLIHEYSHNSLGLILNLFEKMSGKMKDLGLEQTFNSMGLNIDEGILQMADLEEKSKGKTPVAPDKKSTLKQEAATISAEAIDKLVDMMMFIRTAFLQTIDITYANLEGNITLKPEDLGQATKNISNLVSAKFKTKPLDEQQQQAPLEFLRVTEKLGLKPKGSISQNEMNQNYLGTWALSVSLYLLTYITFAHEHTPRYPKITKDNGNNMQMLGFEDYTDKLGIVNRLGRLGYVIGLTLQEMKTDLDSIEKFFKFKPKS